MCAVANSSDVLQVAKEVDLHEVKFVFSVGERYFELMTELSLGKCFEETGGSEVIFVDSEGISGPERCRRSGLIRLLGSQDMVVGKQLFVTMEPDGSGKLLAEHRPANEAGRPLCFRH